VLAIDDEKDIRRLQDLASVVLQLLRAPFSGQDNRIAPLNGAMMAERGGFEPPQDETDS
jgi:hypothetical protein